LRRKNLAATGYDRVAITALIHAKVFAARAWINAQKSAGKRTRQSRTMPSQFSGICDIAAVSLRRRQTQLENFKSIHQMLGRQLIERKVHGQDDILMELD